MTKEYQARLAVNYPLLPLQISKRMLNELQNTGHYLYMLLVAVWPSPHFILSRVFCPRLV